MAAFLLPRKTTHEPVSRLLQPKINQSVNQAINKNNRLYTVEPSRRHERACVNKVKFVKSTKNKKRKKFNANEGNTKYLQPLRA